MDKKKIVRITLLVVALIISMGFTILVISGYISTQDKTNTIEQNKKVTEFSTQKFAE